MTTKKKKKTAESGIRLVEIPRDSDSARREAIEFIQRHYPSEIPTDESSIRSGRILLFWAQAGASGKRVGITGFTAKTRGLAETVKTVIDPAHRGRGFGAGVSQAIEDEVRRRGFTKVMSTIYITNLPMISIKLAQGYRFEGFHPDHEKPGLHGYSFGKVL